MRRLVAIVHLLLVGYVLMGLPVAARAFPSTISVSRVHHVGHSFGGTMAPCSNSSLKLRMSPCDNTVTGQVWQTDTLDITIFNSSSSTSQTVYPVIAYCLGAVSHCSATPSSLNVPFSDQNDFLVIWTNAGTLGTGTITVDVGGMSTTITVNVQNASDFTLDTTTTSLTDQMSSLCANGCFAGATTFSTVPYYTLNTPRNVTLVYTENRMHPRPVIYADMAAGTTTPTQYTLSATLNGSKVVFLNGDTTLYFSGSSSPVRLAGQFNASTYSTGVYTLVVTLTGTFSGVVKTHSYTRLLAIVNESSSPIAHGWTVAGAQHLYISGSNYLITDGSGSATIFTGLGVMAADYTTLTYNAGGSYYVRAYLDSSYVYFNTSGQVTKRVDRLGFTTTYGYTGTQLTSIVDPERYLRGAGLYLTLTYGSHGLASIAETGGARSRTTTVTVAADSTLQTIADPQGGSTNYSYDTNKRLSTITDRRGGVTTYKYGTNSWSLTEVDLPQVAADIGGGNTTNVIPAAKYATWETLGVPTSHTSPSTLATAGLQSAVHAVLTDPIGRQMTYTVNRWGQPLMVIDPASDTTRTTYLGYLPIKVVYPTGGVDTIAYAWHTPLVSFLKTAGDSSVQFFYGAKNQVSGVQGTGYQTQSRFLDSLTGRVDSIAYPDSTIHKSRYSYDGYNRLVQATDPHMHTTVYAYDATFGNVDSVGAPGNLYTITRFDAFGRDSATRSTGSSLWQRTAYDSLNRIVRTWHMGSGGNDTTFLQYDSLYLIRVQTPQHQVYRYATNALGWVTTRYDSYDTLHTYMTFRYDTAGRITSWTNRRGQRIDLTYDVLNRLRTQAVNGSITDSLGYSTNGLIVSAWRPGASSRDSIYNHINGATDSLIHHLGGHRYAIRYTYTYLPTGIRRTVNDTSDAGIVFSQETDALHDSLPARDSITLTGTHGAGTSVTSRNSDGLDTLQQLAVLGVPLQTTYTAQHQSDFRDFASYSAPKLRDSLDRTITYDSLGRVIADHRWGINGRVLGHSFVYDSLGQLLGVHSTLDSACADPEDTLVQGYVYSCTAHLSSVSQDSATYDTVGNRLFSGASYSAAGNRLLAGPSGVTYTYDADGDLATRTHGGVTDSLYWSATGQLDSVVSGSLRRWYQYNSFGQLVQRQTKVGVGAYAVDRYFLWDGSQLVAELSGTSSLIAQYIYNGGTDQPFAIVTDSGGTAKVRYYYQDPQEGNLTGVIRDTLTLDQYTQYTAWGQLSSRPINIMADTNRFGWKGLMYEGDSTRLYYVRNRWYDPVVGRFISEDPISIAGGLNQYAFAGNNPITGMDPSGLSDECPGPDNSSESITPVDPLFLKDLLPGVTTSCPDVQWMQVVTQTDSISRAVPDGPTGSGPGTQPQKPKPLTPAQATQVFHVIQHLLRNPLCRQAGLAAYALYPDRILYQAGSSTPQPGQEMGTLKTENGVSIMTLFTAAFSGGRLQGIVAHEAAHTYLQLSPIADQDHNDPGIGPVLQNDTIYRVGNNCSQ